MLPQRQFSKYGPWPPIWLRRWKISNFKHHEKIEISRLCLVSFQIFPWCLSQIPNSTSPQCDVCYRSKTAGQLCPRIIVSYSEPKKLVFYYFSYCCLLKNEWYILTNEFGLCSFLCFLWWGPLLSLHSLTVAMKWVLHVLCISGSPHPRALIVLLQSILHIFFIYIFHLYIRLMHTMAD